MYSISENSPNGSLNQLITLFNHLFSPSENTLLEGGADEPLYLPASANPRGSYNLILFTRDYFSSALHEIAHWCVAGKERRKQQDYGYWYAPDGRSAQEQLAFESLEVRPQAMEWMFSFASGVRFRASADNLAANLGASETFKQAIHRQVLDYCESGLPARADTFCHALAKEFQQTNPFDPTRYLMQDI